MSAEFPVTYKILDGLTDWVGKTVEKRYPGEKVEVQMIKSPDVMLAGALVLGAVSLTTGPAEIGVELVKKLCKKRPGISG